LINTLDLFELNPYNVISVPTDNTGYMIKGVNAWIKNTGSYAKKQNCSPHLLDPLIKVIIGTPLVLKVISSLRAVFSTSNMLIKRKWKEFCERNGADKTIPHLRKSTRAWGTIWRSVNDLIKIYEIDKVEITKVEMIYSFLSEFDSKMQKDLSYC
jgi:hypothetical protein